MKRKKVFSDNKRLLFILALVVIMACYSSTVFAGSKPEDKIVVFTVNYPLKYFAERIGAEHVTVVFPAPAGVDPAFWMPDAKTIGDYQKADLILLNGAHYARWVEKVTLPRSKMVDTSRKFRNEYITMKHAVTHSHGPEGEHAHEDAAFTIWLDFNLAAKQAKAIEKALSRKRSELKSTFQKKYEALKKDLMVLDSEIREIVSKNPSQPLVVSHPVYDYLIRRYNLHSKSVHWEPDETPGSVQWMELKRMLKDHTAQWMIWEGPPMQDTVQKLKSIGIKSIVFDPCGNVPETGDFLTVMKQNVENLKAVFQ
jgi:zinc transport system substrate-binding protein